MKILTDKDFLKEKCIVTIGSYDGVHYGHRKILEYLFNKSVEYNCKTAVLTLYPHPRKVLNLDLSKLHLLSSLEEKTYLLDKCGISYLYVAEFTKEFSELSGEDYIKRYLVDRLKAKAVIIGYDHHFGKDRMTGYDLLVEMGAKYGFEVYEIPKQDIDAANVSSTVIRNMLERGEIENANKYLVEPYLFIGDIGADGVLVINDELKLIPPFGNYLSEVEIGNKTIIAEMFISSEKKISFNNEKLHGEGRIVKIISKKQ